MNLAKISLETYPSAEEDQGLSDEGSSCSASLLRACGMKVEKPSGDMNFSMGSRWIAPSHQKLRKGVCIYIYIYMNHIQGIQLWTCDVFREYLSSSPPRKIPRVSKIRACPELVDFKQWVLSDPRMTMPARSRWVKEKN